jgi:hypothetical protein
MTQSWPNFAKFTRIFPGTEKNHEKPQVRLAGLQAEGHLFDN